MKKKIIAIAFLLLIVSALVFKAFDHEHVYGSWIEKIAATEDSVGLEVRKCDECGKKEERVIPKLIHIHDNNAEIIIEPSCITAGLLRNTCKTCGYVEDLELDKDAEGHSYSAWVEVLDKMTNKTGTKTRTCSLCNKVDEQEHNHELGEWTTIKEETCLATGLAEGKCVHCSYTEEMVIPIGDHKFTDWEIIKESTCNEKGFTERHCIYCELKEESELLLDDTAHKYGEWEVLKEATTTETGLIAHTCSICGKYEEVVMPVHVHEFPEQWETVVQPTCNKGGTLQRSCTGCGYTETSETKPDESLHEYGEWTSTKEPTCSAAGQIKRTCKVCKKDQFEIVPEIEHDYQLDWTTKPGYVLDKCTMCGHVKEEYKDSEQK